MSKRTLYISFPILLLLGAYFLGPAPLKPTWNEEMPVVPGEPDALEGYVRNVESKHVLKPDNEARIIWNDSTRKKTPYSVVYLHGFRRARKKETRSTRGSPVSLDVTYIWLALRIMV